MDKAKHAERCLHVGITRSTNPRAKMQHLITADYVDGYVILARYDDLARAERDLPALRRHYMRAGTVAAQDDGADPAA